MSEQRPTRGCNFLAAQLAVEGVSLSAVTVQNILTRHGRGGRYERLPAVPLQALQEGMELTTEQVTLIEKANPIFRERHVESSRPGEMLCQDPFFVGRLRLVTLLARDCITLGRHTIRRYRAEMGLATLFPKPSTASR